MVSNLTLTQCDPPLKTPGSETGTLLFSCRKIYKKVAEIKGRVTRFTYLEKIAQIFKFFVCNPC